MKREFQFEEAGGTQTKDYGGTFGKEDYGSNFGGSYKGESSQTSTYQPRNNNYSETYKQSSNPSSRPKGGWEDVKKAQESYRIVLKLIIIIV